MTPDPIVVSLEVAKKLRAAGFPQQTDFFWHTEDSLPAGLVWDKKHAWDWNDQFIAAPTAEEILRRLPRAFLSDGKRWVFLQIQPEKGKWNVLYCRASNHVTYEIMKVQPTIADAAAAMYCFLSDHNLL